MVGGLGTDLFTHAARDVHGNIFLKREHTLYMAPSLHGTTVGNVLTTAHTLILIPRMSARQPLTKKTEREDSGLDGFLRL